MLQLLRVSASPTVDIQGQASREVAGNYRILLVRDRVQEYSNMPPDFPQDVVSSSLSWHAENC